MPKFKMFNEVCKTAVISLLSIQHTQNLPQDGQLELPHHPIKFHADQMKSVGENEAKSCFALTI